MRLACELRQEGWEIAGIDLSGDPAVGEWYENGCFNCLSLRSVWTINCPSRSLWFVSNSLLSTAFYLHFQGDFCPCFKVCARAGISFSSSLWRGLVTLTFNFSFEKRQVGLCCLRFVVIVLLQLSPFCSCSYQFTFCQLLFWFWLCLHLSFHYHVINPLQVTFGWMEFWKMTWWKGKF